MWNIPLKYWRILQDWSNVILCVSLELSFIEMSGIEAGRAGSGAHCRLTEQEEGD